MKTLHRKASTILVAATLGAGLGGVDCATEPPKRQRRAC
jgi:hypothetical protein